MRQEELDLISCHYCRIKFQHDEKIHSIVAMVYNDFAKEFQVLYTPVVAETTKGVFDLPSIQRALHFHSACFVKVAGEDYLI